MVKEKEEKEIAKIPTTKLKKIALEIGGIEGVHGMTKEQLIQAIKAVRGDKVTVTKVRAKKLEIDRTELKSQIRMLKKERDQMTMAGDKKTLKGIRKKIKRLKRLTRKA